MSGFFESVLGAGGALGGGFLGGVGGGAVGGVVDGAIGAGVGSVVPGAGTAAGAVAGAGYGAVTGAAAGGIAGGVYGYSKGSAAGASIDKSISDWWNGDQTANQAQNTPVPATTAPADSKAKSDAGTATATCTTGNCGDDCARLIQQIENQAAALEKRMEDMVLDNNDLYNTARGLGDNQGKGTWQGHIDRYETDREELKASIALADSKKCKVPDWAREAAKEGPPKRPGY